MSRLLPLTMLFLLGCPVEPKDIQDVNAAGPGKPTGGQQGQGMGGQPPQGQGDKGGPQGQGQGQGQQGMGGLPPGAPGAGQEGQITGDQGPLPEGQEGQEGQGGMGQGMGGQPQGQNQQGMDGMPQNPEGGDPMMVNGEGGQPPQGNGDTVPSLPLGEGEQTVTDENGNPQFENAPLGDVPLTEGKQGEIPTPEGTHPTPDFAHQPGEIPNTAGDVLPMYQQPPQFSDFMGEEQITIILAVDGATSFDLEFVVKREGDGRIYPKVLHKQSDVTSPVTITAPATIDEPVWLVITADNTGDGPTPDDLVGGSPDALLFAGEDMNLSYSLEADDSFMQSLPWFSQAQGTDGPQFEK